MRGHVGPKRAVTMPKWLVTMGRNTQFDIVTTPNATQRRALDLIQQIRL
jgi:hypothetical protein